MHRGFTGGILPVVDQTRPAPRAAGFSSRQMNEHRPMLLDSMEVPVAASDTQGLKVLVIDDSKTIRRTAETLLQKAGCDVVTAVDGFEALSVIAETRPDIIFVDIMMPRLDGYHTCKLIKQNSEFRNTPVVMLSSKDGLFDRARGRVSGCEDYLTKPFTRDEILGAIERHVQRTA
jgi:twitching motility two-component system response regulator PilG